MKKLSIFLLTAMVCLIATSPILAQGTVMLFKGSWGKDVNQLGIRLPSPGVMPVAPYACIGGFDVDAGGGFWFSDSVNSMLKCYKDKTWSYIMLNFGRLGDLACYRQKIYVLTREPDGIAVVDPAKGKVERQVKIDFKNPGRIKIVSEQLFLIEEPGIGLLICKNGQTTMHPAVALEAAASENRIFGVQFNLENDSRSIIAAEIADEVQEPEMLGLYEAGEEIIYIKTAGTVGNRPVLMVSRRSNPAVLDFIKLGDQATPEKTVSLPVFDAPFLPASWKLCSDGRFYGFSGSVSEGFKVYRAENAL